MTINLRMGGQDFVNVEIPVLWGSRAVLQDPAGRVSVIDLGGEKPTLEVLGDKPAPGIAFVPTEEGFQVMHGNDPVYTYDRSDRRLSASSSLGLPDCQIGSTEIRVGSNVFSGSTFVGSGVGIAISGEGIAVGAPLPSTLAKLRFP